MSKSFQIKKTNQSDYQSIAKMTLDGLGKLIVSMHIKNIKNE